VESCFALTTLQGFVQLKTICYVMHSLKGNTPIDTMTILLINIINSIRSIKDLYSRKSLGQLSLKLFLPVQKCKQMRLFLVNKFRLWLYFCMQDCLIISQEHNILDCKCLLYKVKLNLVEIRLPGKFCTLHLQSNFITSPKKDILETQI
jgi:hypothetical protein